MNDMNEVVDRFLKMGDKFMPEIHLRDPIVGTYSASGPFTKNKQRIQKFMKTGNRSVIFKNKLDKACFQHDIAYEDFKDLKRKKQSDKVLKDKSFAIARNPKYDGYQRGLASMVYRFFSKKSKGSGIKNKIKENKLLANELHKPIIRKFKKRKVYSSLQYNIWGVHLADMQLITKYNKKIRYSLCRVNIFSKYAWIFPLKDEKGITVTNAFQSILDSSKRKPNKIWVDQGSEFYNNVF